MSRSLGLILRLSTKDPRAVPIEYVTNNGPTNKPKIQSINIYEHINLINQRG